MDVPRHTVEGYDGFRIQEVWLFTAVDPTDDQEGVLSWQHPLYGSMPMMGTDSVARDSLLPIAQEYARDNPDSVITMKHFTLAGTEEVRVNGNDEPDQSAA